MMMGGGDLVVCVISCVVCVCVGFEVWSAALSVPTTSALREDVVRLGTAGARPIVYRSRADLRTVT